MVSRRPPDLVRKGCPAQVLALHSPLEKTPHNECNGELSISCRDRHCPKCQTAARERWIAARRRELLPTRYLHVVFTLPRHLAPVVLQNKKVIYDLLGERPGILNRRNAGFSAQSPQATQYWSLLTKFNGQGRVASKLSAKRLRKVRDVHSSKSRSLVVAVAPVIEPIVAVANRVQRRVLPAVSFASPDEIVERIVQ
jgi:Transposase zinc-binding domain